MLRTKINEYIVMYLRISDPEKGFHGNWKARQELTHISAFETPWSLSGSADGFKYACTPSRNTCPSP
jgi:hypothetical protein